MLKFKILKGSLLLIILRIQTLSYNTEGSPFFADIREKKSKLINYGQTSKN